VVSVSGNGLVLLAETEAEPALLLAGRALSGDRDGIRLLRSLWRDVLSDRRLTGLAFDFAIVGEVHPRLAV